MEHVDHVVEIALELALLAEGLRIERHEEVSDPVRIAASLRALADRRERAARERRREDLHHDAEAVALVARHLGRAAECGDAACVAHGDEIHRPRRIGHGRAVFVEHPAGRQRAALELEHLHFVLRHRARRHVEQEGGVATRRRGEGDGVGAEHGNGAARRQHGIAARRARDHAEQPAPRRHRGVVAGGAEVGRVADADDADAARRRLGDRQLHPEHGGDVAESGVAVDERGHGRLAHDARHRRGVELLEAERFLVEHEHGDAVRVDAGEVGVGHDVRGGPHDVVRHAPGAQDFTDLAVDGLGREAHRAGKLLPRHRVGLS